MEDFQKWQKGYKGKMMAKKMAIGIDTCVIVLPTHQSLLLCLFLTIYIFDNLVIASQRNRQRRIFKNLHFSNCHLFSNSNSDRFI